MKRNNKNIFHERGKQYEVIKCKMHVFFTNPFNLKAKEPIANRPVF